MTRLIVLPVTTVLLLSFSIAVSAQSALHPQWFGTWTSSDGSRLQFSASKLVVSGFHTEKGKKKAFSQILLWNPAAAESFGYSHDKRWNPSTLLKRYEDALRSHNRRDPDWGLVDPVASRQAIASLSPGNYRVVEERVGPDCNAEYIIDADKILQIMNCRFFGVKLFVRAPGGTMK